MKGRWTKATKNNNMPFLCRYDDVDAAPFDEPPVSTEFDLDRILNALKEGAPIPKVTATVLNDMDEESEAISRPHDEHYQYASSPRRSSQGKRNRSGDRKKKKFKNITFAKQLVDVVPDNWQPGRYESYVDEASTLASSRHSDFEVDSMVSQDNSLDYFIQGEWIEQDELFETPCCTSSKADPTHKASDNQHKQVLCGLYEKYFFNLTNPVMNPIQFNCQPFKIPLRWKENTSLDSECFNISFCGKESCRKRRSNPSRASPSICSHPEDDNEEEERQAVTQITRDIRPQFDSLQGGGGRFVIGNSGESKEALELKTRSEKTQPESDSITEVSNNGTDSDDSTLADTNMRLIVEATVE